MTLRCEQCASTDLQALGGGDYRCNHCKAHMRINVPATVNRGTAAPTARTTPKPPEKPLSLPRRIALLMLMGGLFAAAISLKAQRAARIQEARRQRALQRDIAARLDAQFANRPGLNVAEITGGKLAGADGRLGGAGDGAPAKPSSAVEFGADAVEAPKSVLAAFHDAVAVPDRIGNVYFIGIYKNTGQATIDHPRVEATLWDSDKHKLAVGAGFAPQMNLLPGEETPVKVLVQHAPKYASVTYNVDPRPLRYGAPERFSLTISGAKLQPDPYSGYRLTGRVRNDSNKAVQFVHLAALLLDEGKTIVGMQDGFSAQRVLPPGDESPFMLHITSAARTPKSFRLYTSASAADK